MIVVLFTACFLVAAFFGIAGLVRTDLDALSMSAYITASFGSAYIGLDLLQMYISRRTSRS